MDNYLHVLEESLIKKNTILDQIYSCSKKQEQLLKDEDFSFENFDQIVEEKDGYVEELTKLDDGFETLYNRISVQLSENRAKYGQEISEMQKLIAGITEKSVEIQALEARNKASLEQMFRRKRDSLKVNRQSSKAAYDYYKSMNNGSIPVSQYMDQKN